MGRGGCPAGSGTEKQTLWRGSRGPPLTLAVKDPLCPLLELVTEDTTHTASHCM